MLEGPEEVNISSGQKGSLATHLGLPGEGFEHRCDLSTLFSATIEFYSRNFTPTARLEGRIVGGL